MNRVDISALNWTKSSISNGQNNCVEVATIPAGTDHPKGSGGLAVRNSQDPDGPVLIFTLDEWRAFVGGAKLGEFDLD
ncbi:DUF397 domain-containing protein [Nonomuraea sp. NPDC002799]